MNSLLSANMGLSQREQFWHQPKSHICHLFPVTISCCFHELDLFLQYKPCVWCQWMPFEHGREMEWANWEILKEKVCIWMFVWWFLDRTSKTQSSKETACSVCIISHANMHTQCLYTHKAQSTHRKCSHTNTANHSSIFYGGMRKTSASLCKLQLMCVRRRSRLSLLRMQK